jgi:hypothetical protein
MSTNDSCFAVPLVTFLTFLTSISRRCESTECVWLPARCQTLGLTARCSSRCTAGMAACLRRPWWLKDTPPHTFRHVKHFSNLAELFGVDGWMDGWMHCPKHPARGQHRAIQPGAASWQKHEAAGMGMKKVLHCRRPACLPPSSGLPVHDPPSNEVIIAVPSELCPPSPCLYW